MKKRGFGIGKWNGFGGKLQDGEDIKAAMVRELQEEAGVNVLPKNLIEAGTLNFRFKDNSDWDNFCYVFTANEWTGEPSESEEMRPKWYATNALPFDNMWIDDPYWLPLVLAGKTIHAEFLFDAEGKVLLQHKVN
jgi:8-oxo-dGTP diphosphatase